MRSSRQAFTLIEVVIAAALFTLISGIAFFAIRNSTDGLNTIEGNFDAQAQLRRASSWVLKDLQQANPNALDSRRVLPGHGSAVWFLSAIDPATGNFVRDVDGRPLFQRNVLYYLIRPNNHGRVSGGYNCNVDDATYPNGDPFCPHKLLIRKVIRNNAVAADPEILLSQAQVTPFLTQPNGYDLAPMAAEFGFPGVEPNSIRVVGTGLVGFEVDRSGPPFLQLAFQSVRLREAEREVAVGTVPLNQGPLTVEVRASVFPRN